MKAAIMGYGTIGSGVYEVLDKNCKIVEKKAGEPIKVKYILDLREFPGSPVEKLVVHDIDQIINDPEIGIVWPELTGAYSGSASPEGYALADGTPLNLSEKDTKWLGLKETFHF